MTTATAETALEITRVFDAAPERVFDAWLSKSWGEWAGPPGVTGEVVLMEPQVGGRYRLNARMPDGQQLSVSGTYKEIERPRKIRFTWKWDHDDHETEVTLVFRLKGTGTEIAMRHAGFRDAAGRDSHQSGWVGTLDKLEKFLAA